MAKVHSKSTPSRICGSLPPGAPVIAKGQMTELIISAATLREARKSVPHQIPPRYYVVSEKVVAEGQTRIMEVAAFTAEQALEIAQQSLPADAFILEKTVSAPDLPAKVTVKIVYRTMTIISIKIALVPPAKEAWCINCGMVSPTEQFRGINAFPLKVCPCCGAIIGPPWEQPHQ